MSYSMSIPSTPRAELEERIDAAEPYPPLEADNQFVHIAVVKRAWKELATALPAGTEYAQGYASGHVCPRDADGNPLGAWSTTDSVSVSISQASPPAVTDSSGTGQ